MHGKLNFLQDHSNNNIIRTAFWAASKQNVNECLGIKKLVDLKKNQVNGSVKLKLYKGNITILSRQSKSKAYSVKKVSFEENKSFKKSKVEKFISGAARKLRA